MTDRGGTSFARAAGKAKRVRQHLISSPGVSFECAGSGRFLIQGRVQGEINMTKLMVQDLNQIKEKAADAITFSDKTYLLICGGTGCHATGSIPVKEALEKELADKGLDKDVNLIW